MNSTVQDDLENIAKFGDDDFDYTERHHPLPISLGGTKIGRSSRFVTIGLTFQEHFRAHQLLTGLTIGEDRRKMQHALSCMIMKNDAHKGRILTSEQYAIARRAARDAGSALKGKRRSREAVQKGAASHRGQKRSIETCKRISAALMGRKNSPEHIEKSAAGNRGKRHSPETREKIAAAQRGTKRSAETRERIAAPQRRIPRGSPSIETRRKMSAALKGYKHTSAARANMRAGCRNRKSRALRSHRSLPMPAHDNSRPA